MTQFWGWFWVKNNIFNQFLWNFEFTYMHILPLFLKILTQKNSNFLKNCLWLLSILCENYKLITFLQQKLSRFKVRKVVSARTAFCTHSSSRPGTMQQCALGLHVCSALCVHLCIDSEYRYNLSVEPGLLCWF